MNTFTQKLVLVAVAVGMLVGAYFLASDVGIRDMLLVFAGTVFGWAGFKRPGDDAASGKPPTAGAASIVFAVLMLPGCAMFQDAKPVLRTVDDIATNLCAIHFSERQGISIEDAARAFCDTKRKVQPFLDEVLAAKQSAGTRAEAQR